jgi:F-type H+-transporting ATPase subunit c
VNKLVKIVALLFVVALVCAPCAVFAQDASAATDAVASSSVDLHSLYGIGAGIVLLGAALGIGRIGSSSVESMARQPEVAGKINTAMIISAALIEGVTFFALIVCMLK